ncbi:hypothetical protein WH52_08070 [Tenacibaculum holothuriorum]|uniref:BD-FAE-like domain-containing protein n=1 Tax=Tenacibaculum holothuriorum TaxID=1635173 RepID=A0A1Y2PD90_9FLAO|nr:alpha/beta hydrolase [Tenacibaculum holothuriorum]OSY87981.1 hypothetical protein WH52_08070 [Tenacibaculum holothuriorum]
MIRATLHIIIFFISIIFSFAQVTTEEILIKNDSIELAGTLSFTKEKTPLLIWVHGSGNVDRNGNQAPRINANYIKQLRDSLNQQNIAFFSYDKRTANKNNRAVLLKGVLFEDYVSDVNTVINHFKKDNRFSEIILIGHSQGSLVAMLASKNVDKIISIAGPSLAADKAIIKQISEKAPYLDSIAKAHFKELNETDKIKEVNPMLVSLLHKRNQPFIKSWMQYNPSEEIKKLNIPILIINGTSDLQVKVEEARKLHQANLKSELVIIDKMNHVLKEVNSVIDNKTSYFKADFPLSKELIKTIVTFVNK